jgi:DNA oxidative demethylase
MGLFDQTTRDGSDHQPLAPEFREPETLEPGAAILRGFALPDQKDLLAQIENVSQRSPFRHMVTPGGFTMSVAMTNCGPLGWVTDRKGYRYQAIDPLTGKPWPEMPKSFAALAKSAAEAAGFPLFSPDACLINRYEPGARMSLHQDKDEQDFTQPIVSLSLGLPAIFLYGGDQRSDKARRIAVSHGDVVVWGGPARLRYHGVAPLKEGAHPVLGRYRYNLTFRRAGAAAIPGPTV